MALTVIPPVVPTNVLVEMIVICHGTGMANADWTIKAEAVDDDGRSAGAVYTPLWDIVSADEKAAAIAFMDQVKAYILAGVLAA